VAHQGQIPTSRPVGQLTLPLARARIGGRAVIDRRAIHVSDVLAEGDEYPESRKNALQLGYRTALAVPLVHAGEAIGVIFIRRVEVSPFTERQVELVNTFADQAVIAIENTRLFNEVQQKNAALNAANSQLTETLEQQRATGEILKVIASSPSDVQPVFDAIVAAAPPLVAGGITCALRLLKGDTLHVAAWSSLSKTKIGSIHIGSDPRWARLVRDRQPIAIADLNDISLNAEYRDELRKYGVRSALLVPLLQDGLVIGAIAVGRAMIGPFAEHETRILQTFADQAVIAIENTRLFGEVQARTRELAKTVEDLEIASQHKNQFVANMSHELRTPLAAILGYAELIQEGFYEPQGPKSLDALTRIRFNGKHLLGLINTVLDIAKIESGQFTLNMTEYAIESVVETVRAATESLAQNKKLTLTTSVDKSLPVGLGDEQRLTQVLLNLVGNAIKFTDAGEVSIAAGARNGHFSVSVTDTGPGIPLDQQDRIFDQFHQVDSSLTKAKGGTGLGLAIAKQIIEMHGGRIWVESTVGKGSTFQMEIPTRAEFRKRAL
jgi:signal transduction histidine kinase